MLGIHVSSSKSWSLRSYKFCFFIAVVKEYSVLAIHNACDGNLANQEFVESLTKVGDVPSAIISEFSANTIRIQKAERRSSSGT